MFSVQGTDRCGSKVAGGDACENAHCAVEEDRLSDTGDNVQPWRIVQVDSVARAAPDGATTGGGVHKKYRPSTQYCLLYSVKCKQSMDVRSCQPLSLYVRAPTCVLNKVAADGASKVRDPMPFTRR